MTLARAMFPPVAPTRRSFLSRAAGGAVLALAAPQPAVAEPAPDPRAHLLDAPDPILAVIDAHRIACENLDHALKLHSRLEGEIPQHLRKSIITDWETEIVDTDDPRWIESESTCHALIDADTKAALDLIETVPTTLAGAAALMRYVASLEENGHGWPGALHDDDDKQTGAGRDWTVCLHCNIAAVLERVAA
jgi:hypothetical protein